jgi:hypothetical protein
MLLYVCPLLLYVCFHTTVCVLILLYMCPHTASALTGDAAAVALYIRAYTAHRRDRVKDMLQYGAVQGALDQVSGRISALKDP